MTAAAPRVRVALPWLQPALAAVAANGALPTLDAFGWLGGRGVWSACPALDWREWLLEPVGGSTPLHAAPAGPAVARTLAQTIDGTGTWCLAHPVHLATGLDHLRLAALDAASPTAEEAAALAATVAGHFADGSLRIHGFHDGAWLLRLATPVDCTTQPPDTVVGHDVHDSMPAGRDGARVRSLMNELQMLLHEHPVNVQRERRRQLPINGWWLWGFGADAATPLAAAAGWALHSDDPWLRALWPLRATGREAWPGTLRIDTDTLVGLAQQPPASDPATALSDLDAGLLAALAAHLRTGAIQRAELLAGARVCALDRAARWRFWRRPLDLVAWLA